MKISDLININSEIEILGITDDSREVKDGYLFVATKGYNVDHYDYIGDAINNGCVFVISDREFDYNIPYYIVDNINDYFFELCLKFYNIDLDDYSFIGITGTDGKTTTASIVKELIDNSAYIGTNGLDVSSEKFSTNNTTPCISELYKDLSIIKSKHIKTTVMEVSSEALLHDRVKNFKYDIVGFTNITGDHLNIHKTFDNYVKCKMKLLDLVKDTGYVVVNGDDTVLHNIDCKNVYTFGFNDKNMYVIKNVKYLKKNTLIELVYKDNTYKIESPLRGRYNVYNVVMSFIIGLLYGIDAKSMLLKIKNLKPISGRCEFLDFGQNFDIVLDYAHTINGIKNILESFRNYKMIITVTGCAGGREKEKRNIIGNLVMNNSDVSIFTMDDPRYEDVDEIINQMVGDRKDYVRIVNREEAINYALSIASNDSVVLILGKGRDNYMALEDKKEKYSDYEVVKNYFS